MRILKVAPIIAMVLALVAYGTPALGQAGTVWAWGYNFEGELGNGDNENTNVPVQTLYINDAVMVDAGDYHTVALESDGLVAAWGENLWGQLGDGTTEQSWWPVQVLNLTNIKAIACGDNHTLALKGDGTVWAWGDNWNGQLGDGTRVDALVPVQVHGPGDVGFLTDVVAIAAGSMHSMALRSDGTLWAWGYNYRGRLGDGTTDRRTTPVQVVGLTNVKSFAGGYDHSIAVGPDNTVWTWGGNYKGQLGDGTTDDRYTPGQVPGLSNIRSVAAGYWSSLALRSDGTVAAWGYNQYGQLGDGTNTTSYTPVGVLGLSDVAEIDSGEYFGLARKSNGTIWAWGWNDVGQMGDGTNIDRWSPVQVGSLTGVGSMGGGYSHGVVCISDNAAPVADDQSVTATTGVAKSITLTGSDGNGDPLTYHIVSQPSHGSLAGSPPNVVYTSSGDHSGSDSFTFKVNDGKTDSLPATVSITLTPAGTTLYTIDRSGIISETVQLRQYDLKRTTDMQLLSGKTITYKIDGTAVGSAVTDAGGDSSYVWTISDGAATRTITAEFAGDAAYGPSSGTAALAAQSWTTKMVTFNRTARITDRTELKARLLRSDNAPLYGKSIRFSIDGTFIIARNTNTDGYASHPNYDVPNGAGAGVRTILSEWLGNGGYAPISRTATLTVQKAIPYIWVLRKTVPQGGIANLYAYFRRLYDYQKQVGKTVEFSVDGTPVQTVVTDEVGVARHLYKTVEPVGSHVIRCSFAGDDWLDAGFGETELLII